ncbi:MAG: alpha/beta fold hydrolase [Ignavibacteriales bacterium]|nr:alpha/beta fold hydrolase [Ignavibacteriales bacterium]
MLLDLLHTAVRRRFRALGFRSCTLESRVGRLHYLLRDHAGPETSLILVHGMGTSSSTWLKTLPLLKRDYRIMALDLPGFGFSTVRSAGGFCTLEEHVGALTDVLDAVEETPFILVGHSFGGWVSALYASRHPERVRHLVLVDTAGVYYRGVERLRDLFTLNSVSDTRHLLNNLWYRYPWYFKPFAGSIYRELRRRGMNELVDSIDTTGFLVEELARLTMPVSIIWGRQDTVISPESVKVLTKFVPHARVEFIGRCGHVPQLERPVEFVSVLETMLGEQSDELA